MVSGLAPKSSVPTSGRGSSTVTDRVCLEARTIFRILEQRSKSLNVTWIFRGPVLRYCALGRRTPIAAVGSKGRNKDVFPHSAKKCKGAYE